MWWILVFLGWHHDIPWQFLPLVWKHINPSTQTDSHSPQPICWKSVVFHYIPLISSHLNGHLQYLPKYCFEAGTRHLCWSHLISTHCGPSITGEGDDTTGVITFKMLLGRLPRSVRLRSPFEKCFWWATRINKFILYPGLWVLTLQMFNPVTQQSLSQAYDCCTLGCLGVPGLSSELILSGNKTYIIHHYTCCSMGRWTDDGNLPPLVVYPSLLFVPVN